MEIKKLRRIKTSLWSELLFSLLSILFFSCFWNYMDANEVMTRLAFWLWFASAHCGLALFGVSLRQIVKNNGSWVFMVGSIFASLISLASAPI